MTLLLCKGADVNLFKEKKIGPLFVACENGNIGQILLNKGGDVNLCAKTGISPLYVNCQNEREDILKL